MSNPLKGETPLVLADGRTLTLVMDFEALVQAEAAYAKPLAVVLADAAAGFIGATRAILFGALRTRHPEIGLRAAGELLNSDGDAVEAALTAATDVAFPPPASAGARGSAEDKEAGNARGPAGTTSGASGAKPGSTRKRSGKPRPKPSG